MTNFDIYQLTLIALSIFCSALFLYISLVFLRIYLRIRVEYLALFSASFMSLTLSQVASAFSNIVTEPRLSLTLFTLSSSLASSGFLIMLFSILYASREKIIASLPPTLLLNASPDLLAFLLSLTVAVLTRGKYLKRYFLILSATYLVRGLSSLLIPLGIGVYLLVISEFFKTIATLIFATYHLSKVTTL